MIGLSWYRGQLVPGDALALSLSDRGALLGEGAFETLAVRSGQVQDLGAHLSRLVACAGLQGIVLEIGEQDVAVACAAVIAANGLDQSRAGLRLTLTGGAGARGARAHDGPGAFFISGFEVGPPPSSLSLATVDIRRNETSPLNRFKSLSYGDNLVARRQAMAKGADEGLMLNTRGHPACGAMANLFVVEADGGLATPSIEEGAREGVTRERLIAAATAQAIPLRFGAVSTAGWLAAGLSNTRIGLVPVSRLDDRPLIVDHPILKRLAAAL
jgi:branched-subunit amino acid aminotransferase/4-amino-4-deoxychorismate lyase